MSETLLATAFREQAKKTKNPAQINEMQHSVAYPFGFLTLDFLNGHIVEIGDKLYPQVGVVDGSINAIISRSGGGKTTFAIQGAGNIIRPFKTSCVFFDAAEVGTVLGRAMDLSGLDPYEFKDRFIIRDSGITTDSVYERIKMIYDIKMANYNDYVYNTGMIDHYGSPITKLEPTVYIMDSLKMIMPEKIQVDEATNMAGAQTAKANADMFTRLLPMCRAANIIIIIINHITTDVNTGVMPKKSQLAYLKQGESLPGGKTATYLQNNVFRFDDKSKLKSEEAFGIDGAIVAASIVKSRTNKAGKDCTLVFNQELGFDPDLSLFLMLKEEGILEGGGAYLKLPNHESKFTQKAFKDKLYSEPDFYAAFVEICVTVLKKELMDRHIAKKKDAEAKSKVISPYMSILSNMDMAV